MGYDPYSLPRSLVDAARQAGYELAFDDLTSVLGLPWLFCAVPIEPDLTRWPMYARDAFLIQGSRLLGMDIRPIHPPETALGLDRVVEFEQHFEASYRPLIHRALENGQGVLAWRGWDGSDLMWGRITQACSKGAGFRGLISLESRRTSGPTLLERPATQVYVVERITSRVPERTDLLQCVLENILVIMENGLADRFSVVSGPGALDMWRERIKVAFTIDSPSFHQAEQDSLVGSCHVLTLSFLDTQQAAIRFLRKLTTNGMAGHSPVLALLLREADNAMTVLRPLSDRGRWGEWMASESGRAIIAAKLDLVRDAFIRIRGNLRAWLKKE